MPKFNVEASFSLSTTVEVDGISFDADIEGVEDFSDDSYWSSQEIEADGGEITMVIEADDEYDAESKFNEAVDDGSEVTDYNGLTWIVTNLNVTVERVEEPMTLERAVELLTKLFARLAENGHVTEEDQEALAFLLKGSPTRPPSSRSRSRRRSRR
jgi:uncharacterized glyoxalase superfamily protein PhnB